MTFLLKLAGWSLCGGSLAIALVAATGDGRLAFAAAVWTALPVFVSGVMLAVFAEVVGYVRSIDRAVTAQYALLATHRDRTGHVPAGRIGPR